MFSRSNLYRWVIFSAVVLCLLRPTVSAEPSPPLPVVVLLGDSIRLGYAPLVAERLAGRATVVSPAANGGDSATLLRGLEEWAIRQRPAVVHFNCGLHDLKRSKTTGRHQMELTQYEGNLKQVVARLQKEATASLVFANTTPVLDARHAARKAEFDRFEADVERYNTAAVSVMKACGVPVNDLHWVVEQSGVEKLLNADGVHYTPAGSAILAEAVADSVLRQLAIQVTARHFRGHSAKAATVEEAARFHKAEAQRDAQVPPAFKNMPVGQFRIPEDSSAWSQERPEVLKAVVGSLGRSAAASFAATNAGGRPRDSSRIRLGAGQYRQRGEQ